MPNTYRYPRVVFPDLAEHQLADKFQSRDRNYIMPGGMSIFIPFDETFLDVTDSIIIVPVIVPTGIAIRMARIHLWVAPTNGFPRGTRIKVNPFLGELSYKRTIYVGMYSILPLDSAASDTLPLSFTEHHSDDMLLINSAILRIKFYDKDDNLLPNINDRLPIFYGQLELT